MNSPAFVLPLPSNPAALSSHSKLGLIRHAHLSTRLVAQRAARPCALRMSAAPQVKQALETANSAAEAVKFFDGMKESGEFKRWNSARTLFRRISQSELKLITKLDGQALGIVAEDTTDLRTTFAVVLGSTTVLAIVSAAVLPPQAGYFASYGIGGLAIVFLGIGSSAPGLLYPLISGVQSLFSPEAKQRVYIHEAAHLLVGHLVGIPVRDYEVKNPMTTAVRFFDDVPTMHRDLQASSLTRAEVDKLSVVSMAGMVAEAIEFKQAKGGQQDLRQLQGFLLRMKPTMVSKDQEEQTRWAALAVYTIIKQNWSTVKALAGYLETGRDVGDCIALIESSQEDY